MKAKRTLLFGLMAVALSTAASAQTTIRITGSTAYRAGAHTAIGNILQPGYTFGYLGTSFTGAGSAIFTGTTKAPTNTSVIIKTYWTGSTGGIKAVVQNIPLGTASVGFLVNSTPQSTAGTPSVPASFEAPVIADIAMGDSFQNSTEFRSPVLVDRVVGVLPFQWVRNNGCPIQVDNMTPLLAVNLLNGFVPLSQWTLNPLDADTLVYASGRDEDSGTRLVTYAESFFGVFSSPTQYRINLTGSTVNDIEVWPPATVLGTPYPLGHSGEASGGTLVTKLNATGSSTNTGPHGNAGWVVAYAGINDAANVVSGTVATATSSIGAGAVTGVTLVAPGFGGTGYSSATTVSFSGGGGTGAAGTPVIANGVITGVTITNGGSGYTSGPTVAFRSGAALKWNGSDYTAAGVREGQYTFWSYQHVLYRPGYANAAIADQYANQIKNVDGVVSGILLSTMHVGRPVEGGDVTLGNPYP